MKVERVLYIVLIFFVFSCSDEKKETKENNQIENFGSIITPAQGQSVTSGEEFKIELGLAEIPEGFKKVVFKVDGQEVFSSEEPKKSYSHSMNSVGLTMGFHTITTEIWMNDERELNTTSILVTSDLVPKRYSYLIRKTHKHNIDFYTQGLEFKNGVLYEGTGLNGKSGLYQVDLNSGNVMQSIKLDQQYFGEGITIIDDKIYQITYQSNKGFVYDLKTFEKLKEFTYATEGWGLTHNESQLIMSDGTNKIYFLNKETFEREREMEVYDNVGPIYMINELEYIDGEIWANIYLTQDIIRIDPNTGKVTARINCSGIFDPSTVSHKTDVLNGIAYDDKTKKIYLTGKLWPHIYEVEFLNEQ